MPRLEEPFRQAAKKPVQSMKEFPLLRVRSDHPSYNSSVLERINAEANMTKQPNK